MNAAVHDHHKVVKFMLRNGADPDAQTKVDNSCARRGSTCGAHGVHVWQHGETALMFAAGEGHHKTVALLLGEQYGEAKPNLRTTVRGCVAAASGRIVSDSRVFAPARPVFPLSARPRLLAI